MMEEKCLILLAQEKLMGTFLFDSVIFGPVISRRLGVSLGINLLPIDGKLCSFNCIYCECGWNRPDSENLLTIPSRKQVKELLEKQLSAMTEEPDTITFAGNGEPTLHSDFAGIIDDTIELRNKYFPDAQIAVLSNSTTLHKPDVVNALKKIKLNILKLDSAFEETVNVLNNPPESFSHAETIKALEKFNGDFVLQTMFIRGEYKEKRLDNTTEKEIKAWFDIVKGLMPRQIMIYTIARATPASGLEKVPLKKLEEIAGMLRDEGFDVQVSG